LTEREQTLVSAPSYEELHARMTSCDELFVEVPNVLLAWKTLTPEDSHAIADLRSRRGHGQLSPRLLQPRPQLVELVGEARRAGVRITLLTDAHLRSSSLAMTLAAYGLSFPSRVRDPLDVTPTPGADVLLVESTLMSSDAWPHLTSCIPADRRIHVPSALHAAREAGWGDIISCAETLNERSLVSLSSTSAFLDLWDTSPDEKGHALGPTLTCFCIWLAGQLAGQGLDGVLFDAEEGALLRRGYDLVRSLQSNNLPAPHDVYVPYHARTLEGRTGDDVRKMALASLRHMDAHGLHMGARYALVSMRPLDVPLEPSAYLPFDLQAFALCADEPSSTHAWYVGHEGPALLDGLYLSPTPPLSHIDESGKAVFGVDTRSERELQHLHALHEQALVFCDDYLSSLFVPGISIEPALVMRLAKAVLEA